MRPSSSSLVSEPVIELLDRQMFRHPLDAEHIANTIKRDGVVILDAIIHPFYLETLIQEFDQLKTTSDKRVRRSRTYPSGDMFFVNYQNFSDMPSLLPSTGSLLFCDAFRQVKRNILAHSEQERVVFTHDYQSGQITDVHFDTKRALKFLIYLDDVDEQSGAFSYAPGTHLGNTHYRNGHLARGGDLNSLLNIPSPSEAIALRPLTGSAGSLIIFDTDGFHQGGCLAKDRFRRVIRYSALFPDQPDKLTHKKYSLDWFKQKVLPVSPSKAHQGRSSTGGKARKF